MTSHLHGIVEIAGIEQLDPETAAQRMRDGAVMVDVREHEERSQAYIAGTTFIPLSHLQERYEELPRDRLLILQCAGGVRSQQAAQFLQHQGFQVANLMHGITGWYRMGHPVEQ